MNKKILYLIFTLILAISFAFNPIRAKADNETSAYEVLVFDDADILSDDEEIALYESMERILPYGNAFFYSTELDPSEDAQKAAEDAYYFMYENQPGVILQFDMTNRQITLSASTDMEKILHKERDSIVDNIYRIASQGDYYACAAECFDEIVLVINDGQIAHSMKYINNAILALIVALMINFFFVFINSRQDTSYKAYMLKSVFETETLKNIKVKETKKTKTYAPITTSSSSSGSGSSFGSSGSSGGGGGGFSGGSSSHGF